jgi:hypothetical protein
MKNLAAISMMMGWAGLALGQGTIHNPGVVSFQNSETARPAGTTAGFHLIFDCNGGLVGLNFRAELFLVNPDSSLTPIPASISPFRAATTARPGTWDGPSSTVPLPNGVGGVDVFDDGTGETGTGGADGTGHYPVTLRVRAWDSNTGNSWDTSSGWRGETANFTYTQRFSGPPPFPMDTQMINQPGFITCPEPSAVTLSVLGVTALLLFRQRK